MIASMVLLVACSPEVATETLSSEATTGVWASAPNDVWFVGRATSGRGVVLHWDGTMMSSVPVNSAGLSCVWGSAPNNVWVGADDGSVLRWNGSEWSRSVVTDSPFAVRQIRGTGASDVWVVGELSPDSARTQAVFRWDGRAWSSIGTLLGDGADGISSSRRQPSEGVLSLWVQAPNDVWVTLRNGFVRRWNGVRWQTIEVPGAERILSLWGAPSGSLWMVTSTGVHRWTGMEFTPPMGSIGDLWGLTGGTYRSYFDGSGTMFGESDNDLWVVRNKVRCFGNPISGATCGGDVETQFLHWNGHAWNRAEVVQGQVLGASSPAQRTVFLAGNRTMQLTW